MQVLFLEMPGTIMIGVLTLTLVVALYSLAKAIMRWLDKNK